MTSVDATSGFAISPDWLYSPSEAGDAPTNELGNDEFLQLLVAQLKHQDPLNPTSSDEFISTTAQFTVVEKLDELTAETKNSNLVSSLTQAGALVGREISATTNDGLVTAEVLRTSLVSGDVVLETNQGRIRLADVASIGPWSSDTANGESVEGVDSADGVDSAGDADSADGVDSAGDADSADGVDSAGDADPAGGDE